MAGFIIQHSSIHQKLHSPKLKWWGKDYRYNRPDGKERFIYIIKNIIIFESIEEAEKILSLIQHKELKHCKIIRLE